MRQADPVSEVMYSTLRALGRFVYVVLPDEGTPAYPAIEIPTGAMLFIDEESGEYNVYPDAVATLTTANAQIVPFQDAAEAIKATAIQATPVVVTNDDKSQLLGFVRGDSITAINSLTAAAGTKLTATYPKVTRVSFSAPAPAPTPATETPAAETTEVATTSSVSLPPEVVEEIASLRAEAARAKTVMWLAGGVAAWMIWQNYQSNNP
jgi:hypothetical protein